MKVSLIFTVLNESGNIGRLLEAIDAQSRQPDEVLVMDAGSTDGTLEQLREWAGRRPAVIVGSSPGANIASGRNLAIERAAGPVIAVTDAGCVPEPQWLEQITAPFSDSAVQVVMGTYRAEPRTAFERISSCLIVPDTREIKAERYMPSSRSIAFLKKVWVLGARYPEWLDIGEDMFFNFTVRALKARRELAREAAVLWRPRPNLGAFLLSHFKYARGDAIAGMYLARHLIRFFSYAAMVGWTGVWIVAPQLLLLPALLAFFWLRRPYRRALKRLEFAEFVGALVALPALQVLLDGAKMGGYLSGVKEMLKR